MLVSFCRMVINDVEDHLEPALVKAGDHFLEFAKALGWNCGVPWIGRKETNAVISPVIGEPLIDEVLVVDERVDGKQFHRCNAQ